MIAQIVRGNAMPDLVSYLFGPGKHNEHVNQHLVAGYADAVFTADDKLWQNEPGTTRHVRDQARDLGWQVEYPHSRWQSEVPRGYVWHCSLSIKAAEGQLTDAQWTEAAHTVIDALGFSASSGKAPCRWIAVRHGLSKEGNDHIHIAVNLVREDGTKASTWNDYRKAGSVCKAIEERFGLQPVPGRMTGRSVPEPSRADREISANQGEPEPLRVRLERTVRACAAAARSEAQFVALARAHGLLIRPRYAEATTAPAVTGYAVADRNGRHAYSRKTGATGPIWFGGGKLASDLSLPSLRHRWETPGTNPNTKRIEALAAWSAATFGNPAGPQATPQPRTLAITDDAAAAVAADLLAAAATGHEHGKPGPLSQAARHMARAAQNHPPPELGREIVTVIADMASTFLAVTSTAASHGTGTALTLMDEVARLVDACAASATATTKTSDAQQASVLVHTSLDALARAAAQQASSVLYATTSTNHRGSTMSEPTYEEEFLSHMTAAGVLTARLAQAITGLPRPGGTSVEALKAAGFTEQTPFDDHLRAELGEQRWANYIADPARVECAAMITIGARTGYDIPALLSKVTKQRAWEDDAHSPAKSIARVLAYRLGRELDKPASSPSAPHQKRDFYHNGTGTSPKTAPPPPVPSAPAPVTPWDPQLHKLLGDRRWQQYATDKRRQDVAALLTRAAANGHNVDALLTAAVTRREWEDDPVSPSRQVGGVLRHRVEAAIASGEFTSTSQTTRLPSEVAQVVAQATAPADGTQNNAIRADSTGDTRSPARANRPKPDQERG